MHLLVPVDQLWILAIGSLVPLVGYVLNHLLPIRSEAIKGVVQVLLAAAVGALYTAVNTNVIGFNGPTAQLVLSAVLSALLAHHWLWKPSGINVRLGAAPAHPTPAAPPAEV